MMAIEIFTGDSNTFEQQQEAVRRSLTSASGERSPHLPMHAERWLIVGAGGFGREIYYWTQGQLQSTGQDFPIGFLDDNRDSLKAYPSLAPYWVDRISDYVPRQGDRLLMAIADPTIKLQLGKQLTERGATFATYIHPKAVITADAKFGAGCIVCPMTVVCCNVQVGDFVSLNLGTVVGHDSIISDGCTLSPHANISGQSVLERGVFVGCQAVILPKVHVGEFARIGAGSSVIGHVRSHSTMLGVPAKRVSWTKHPDASETKAA
ncbi:acetyltransferase [Schlesneria paludicola]|uniref:acetyltransferase n=1 Tax=Schlesneria paludicola TaxID=360056 RepID=UPI0002E40922|nr:acetyltransferase [Schlesneria paludicola]